MGELGFREAVAMALGGMIGGGIYSAFGLVVAISGKVAWLAFLVAGVVAFCAGYSYVKLNRYVGPRGGGPTYIQSVVGNRTLAGMTGWTLLFGYIGSMALYAYAFASFFSELVGRPHVVATLPAVGGVLVPVGNVVSVFLIGAFVALNLVGVSETGKAEDVLTFFKVAVIAVFGVWGVWYAFHSRRTLTLGFSEVGFSPVVGAAMSFVAFQGWQLLMYDQNKFERPESQIPKAILASIPVATLLYIAVALTTVSILTIPVIAVSPEVSLLYAALPYMGSAGAFVIGVSALFSTASAVNATLFSSALFSRDLIDMGMLPGWLSGEADDADGDAAGNEGSDADDSDGDGTADDENDDGDSGEVTGEDAGGIPGRLVVLVGALSAGFAVYGSLHSITSFASLAFIAVFGGMSYLAFDVRHEMDDLVTALPVVGMVGTAAFFPLLLYSLYRTSTNTFYLVILIGVAVVGVELLYFERDVLPGSIPGTREGD